MEPLEHRRLLAAEPVISEFLASNLANRADEDGTFADWVEIHNPDPAAARDLGGYFLTDNSAVPRRWQFPAGVTLAPRAHLLVWASGKDRRAAGAPLHTNFELRGEGESLALVKPDGATIVSEFASFPAQTANVSYGVEPAGGTLVFYNSPSPGAANAAAAAGRVHLPRFSAQRGFYDNDFSLTLAGDTPGATIRYTTNGTAPTTSSGTVYAGPISVTGTRTVRAIAYKTGTTASAVATHTYLFLDDVLRQPASISGFPNTDEDVNGGSVRADTEMDPDVVNATAYRGMIAGAMTSIPSLLISAKQSDIFGSGGFYDSTNERGVSIELVDPNNPQNTGQVNGGAEAHSHDRLKRSMRISFKASYGPTKWNTNLLKDAPVSGDSAADELDNIVLRAGNNRAWTRLSNPDATTFTEDQWYRDSQIAMSGYGAHGAYVHLYLNGVYWGLYNAAERPDAGWQAEYFGGQEEDYFETDQDQENQGSATRWNYLTGTLINRDLSTASNYNELRQYLDVEGFADYLILNWYIAKTDWPQNNYILGNRNTPTATPTRFFAWDGEWSWDRGLRTTVNGAWVHPSFRGGATDANVLPKIWRAVSRNADFRTLFADRVYRHTANGGALTDQSSLARFDALNAHVKGAVVGESARWGDALASLGHPTRTRDVDWQREVNVLRNLMDGNAAQLIDALRDENYYPSLNPPRFGGQRGGPVVSGFDVTLTNPNSSGTIYYTTDGSDPRAGGGSASSAARTYSGPIRVTATTRVRIRVKSGSTWSAEDDATFSVSPLTKLRVTELMYNPAPTSSPGGTDGDEFEFIELQNTGTTPLNLNGVELDGGIDFTFGDVTLAPGQYAVLAENPAAFAARYGNAVAVLGQYTDKLSDEGERIKLRDAAGNAILDFTYSGAWYPTQAGGQGRSIVVVDPAAAPVRWGEKANWQAGGFLHGTPGRGETAPPANQPPEVSAGPDRSVTLPNATSLDGTTTDDGLPAGGALTAAWSKVSGPGAVTFADAAAVDTTATFAAAGQYVLRLTASDGALSRSDDVTVTVNPAPAAVVVGRYVYYNNSAYDGSGDDNAIAPDKSALLPEQTVSAAHVTSYSKGINGVMIDVDGLAGDGAGLRAGDLTVRAGAGGDPANWAAAPAPTLSVRPGAGPGAADRVVLTWADGAVKNQWLEVTLPAGTTTGLAAADVFYFGSLVGDVNGDRTVNLADFGALRQAFGRTGLPLADGHSDFNRDGAVNLADFGLLRANFGKSLPPVSTSPAVALTGTRVTDAAGIAPAATVPPPRKARAVTQAVLLGRDE